MSNNSVAGGLIRGLSDGISLGTQLIGAYEKNEAYKDKQEIKNVMAEGLEQSKAERQAAIDSNTQIGSAPNLDNTMTMPTYQDASGKVYDSQESLSKAAEKAAPTVDDYYQKNVVPKIRDAYVKQGNQQAADAWDAWSQEKDTQRGMKHWGKALQAAQIGDFKSYADNMVDAYNAPGYYDDGLEAQGYDLVKDKDGNTTGLTLKMKNKETGEEYSQTIHGQDDMIRAGIGLLDPANAFKTSLTQQTAREAALAKAALEQSKFQNNIIRDNRKLEGQGQLAELRGDIAMDNIIAGKKLDRANDKAKVGDKAQALRDAGYDEKFITSVLPKLLGAGDGMYKKAASPQEQRRMLHQSRMSDYSYSKMSAADQAKIIEQDMQLIRGDDDQQDQAPAPQPVRQPGNGMGGGLTQNAASQGRVPMVYDTQTGQMVPYRR